MSDELVERLRAELTDPMTRTEAARLGEPVRLVTVSLIRETVAEIEKMRAELDGAFERCAVALEALAAEKRWDGTIRQPIEVIRALAALTRTER